jgi:hypothetical protein
MSYLDLAAALVVFFLFMGGLGPALTGTLAAWDRAGRAYANARALEFVADSFWMECAEGDPDLEGWKHAVSTVRELESCEVEITPLYETDEGRSVRLFRLRVTIGGEPVEVLGVSPP